MLQLCDAVKGERPRDLRLRPDDDTDGLIDLKDTTDRFFNGAFEGVFGKTD